jgi:hypothetical protein
MGTNYYARIIPKEEDKQKLLDAINNNQYTIIEDLASELYGNRNEYSRKGNVIHLGKRSSGWKFLWNSNVIQYCDGYVDPKTREFIPVWKFDTVYPLTKAGIRAFCLRDDVIITDEYGERQNPKEFLEMAFSWGYPNGLTAKEYQENPKYEAGRYYGIDEKEDKKWKDFGVKVEYYDFESDGLRFSTSISFS